MQPSQHLEPGSVFAKDFRVARVLAQGGMGAVYEAEQLDDGRRVALKLMHPSQVADARLRARFAQEARVGAWIGSEHIVEVFRAGIDEATHFPWLVMELLQGETLAARIARHLPGAMPHDDAWRVLSQLCKALTAAHEKGVVHRDLKPENVFLTKQARSDAPFTVKVLDFGIAKRLNPNDRALNRTSAIGTPLWMAPEQNEDTELSPAADVWAMGLLCFRMFTGRYYWLSANERELNLGWLYSELVSEALVPASQRADMLGCAHLVPRGFDAWLARCLVRDPKARFADAREMTEALATFAPPTFAPFARSSVIPSGSSPSSPSSPPSPSSPEIHPTMMMAAPPQIPSAPTMMLSSPPPAVMMHSMPPMPRATPPLAPPTSARLRSRMVLGVLGAAVLVASAVALWAMQSPSDAQSTSEAAKPPSAPSGAPPAPPEPMTSPLMHPQIEAPQGPMMPSAQNVPSGPISPGMVPVEPGRRRDRPK